MGSVGMVRLSLGTPSLTSFASFDMPEDEPAMPARLTPLFLLRSLRQLAR